MIKKIAFVALAACLSVTLGVSATLAQSGSAKSGSNAKAGSGSKQQVSRAFTNGFNVPSTGVAIEGYCPVCYLSANKAVKGSPEITHDYKGVTYWFVSEDARKTFAANPEKFLPAYGGWCAVGVALGQRFPVDPTNFKVVNGRIMLFLKNAKIDGVDIWNQNEAENLKKANENWKKLAG